LKEAERLEIIENDPCKKVDAISTRSNPRMALCEEEMDILFPKNDQRSIWVWGSLMWTCYFHVMRSTGFRPGEVAGLKKENYYADLGGVYTAHTVNTAEKRIVQRIKTSDKGKKYKVGLLSDQCCRLLSSYVETLPEKQEYLFRVNDGVVTTTTSNKHFVSFAKKAGVELGPRTQYSLRHTFQTMIAGEVEKGTVEELMGHTKYRQGYDHREGKRKLQQLQGLRSTLREII
jgi:integrase